MAAVGESNERAGKVGGLIIAARSRVVKMGLRRGAARMSCVDTNCGALHALAPSLLSASFNEP
jgi:hypothetical protein